MNEKTAREAGLIAVENDALIWICSQCSSENKYGDGVCGCCGKPISAEERAKAENSAQERQNKIEQEKKQEEIEREKRIKEDREIARKREKERRDAILKEKAEKRAAAREVRAEKTDKIKRKLSGVWKLAQKYSGIVLFAITALTVIIATVCMSISGGVTPGWIFFIVLAVLSIGATYFLYAIDDGYDEFDMDDKNIIGNVSPSAVIGAFVAACGISHCFEELIIGVFEEGLLVVFFAGLLMLLFFVAIAAIGTAICVGVAIALPLFLQRKLSTKGALLGLVITAVAACVYLILFKTGGADGAAIVLGTVQ